MTFKRKERRRGERNFLQNQVGVKPRSRQFLVSSGLVGLSLLINNTFSNSVHAPCNNLFKYFLQMFLWNLIQIWIFWNFKTESFKVLKENETTSSSQQFFQTLQCKIPKTWKVPHCDLFFSCGWALWHSPLTFVLKISPGKAYNWGSCWR